MPEISSIQDTQNSENELLDGRFQCKVSLFLESQKGTSFPAHLCSAPTTCWSSSPAAITLRDVKKENFLRSIYLCEKEIVY